MFLANKLNKGGSLSSPDAQFNYVTMLLHGDGTNGAQNNTFLDSSTNNFTITRNGNTTQGSFSPYGANWSNYFDGSGDYFTFANSSNFAFGTGNFTIEFWFNASSALNDKTIIDFRDNGSSNTLILTTGGYVGSAGSLRYASGSIDITSGSTLICNGAWNHCAIVRSGSTVTLYVNGISTATGTDSSNFSITTGTNYIARNSYGGNEPTAYISNLRIVKGTAVYTGNFTPPTAPLTAISGTSLLTCQSNRFVDNSTNNFTISSFGNTSVQRFNPFGASTAYSTSVIGGSGYFDGNDYLNTPSTSQFTASGDFTVSCWFYLQSFSNSYYVVGGNWDGGASDEWLIQIQNNGAIRFLTSAGTSFSSSGVVKLNEWTYFTATRSGTTVTVQLNGTTVSTYTKSDTLGAASKTIYIGQQSGNNWPFNGYISDFRLLSGSAITAIPTAPVSSTSTGLLLSFTNGAIFDNAMMNDLETVGNAQISTSVKKYGTGSLAFDGTGDYLQAPDSPVFNLGSGNWTIESWIYINSAKNYNGFYGKRQAGQFGLALQIDSSGVLSISASITGSSWALGGASLGSGYTTGAWMHVAVTRSGTTITGWLNGTSTGTQTLSGAIFSSTGYPATIGSANDSGQELNGYMDDFRITNGYARYTTTFTPPTKALSDTGP